ncbi:hypothetical protein NDU88_006849 [Pleurodeles waltl]|uniref:Uncharacterized protein n=1 Tax=Pleurodeles waltl TaxID=8319 RepID=A0AAV7LQB2_PLEWA|nr:hypothetical protein NDU88_006846 [Pleurodeles waltl]KAJ1093756.1 hypothetical protein NDU88_006848 [Pleurodeles waltl]KAJ1093757.1 hypothetical protein NDU88_006849 [Pleurodeles waltl]
MESRAPCARAVAASRSLPPPPVLTGPCQSATLSDGEQSAMRQGRGCIQEPGSPHPYSQDPCQRAILRWGAERPVPGPWLLPGAWPPHPCSRAPANAPPSLMESRVPCARAVAASRSLAPRTRTHRTPAKAPSSDGEQCALC